jgi:hypothetical protein
MEALAHRDTGDRSGLMLAVAPVNRVGLVRRLLAAALAKSADVPAQLHPAWVQMAWQRVGIAPPSGAGAARCSAALATVYGLQWTSLSRFHHLPHRIALLPRAELMRVLAAVALHLDRERVRHSIGRGLRAAVIERIGDVAYAGVLASASDGATRTAGGLTMAELEPDLLAARGYAALSDLGHWRSKSALAWVRLALAPAATASQTQRVVAHESDTACALQRLPLYFPEHAWLFGLPMDRALSASTTG